MWYTPGCDEPTQSPWHPRVVETRLVTDRRQQRADARAAMTATRLWDGTKILGDVSGLSVTIEVHHCGTCGVIFGLDSNFAEARRSDKASWCCPNGHSFSWRGKPEVEKLRDQLREEQRRIRATRDLLASEERSHAATRGHLTRTRKRVANGVCPCCNRHFTDLERHMHNKHPGYAEAK